jgi:hypothetical protein
MRHYTGHFAGATPYTLLAVSHNKTIHGVFFSGLINLIFYMNNVFTWAVQRRQCTFAQKRYLIVTRMLQINLSWHK